MPRLASLGLGLGPDAAAAAAAAAAAMAPSQPSSSQPSSTPSSSRASANKKRRAAVAGAWGQRLRAAGIETAEELLVLAPDSAAARLLSSKGPSPPQAGGGAGAPQQQPPPPRVAGRPVGRKELERLQAAVAARVAPPPLLHPAAAATLTDATNGVRNSQPHGGAQPQHGGGGQRGQKRPRPSSASALSSASSSPPSAAAGTAPSPFPLPRLGRAVRTTAWDEWRHVAGGGVGGRVLPTGCRSIDRLLAWGGLPFHEVCEVLGPSAAGKTQLCLSLAAQASLGLGAGVVYLDSTGAFCARRLRGILLEQAMQRQQQPPPTTAAAAATATAVTAAATAAADAALGRVRCLRVADDQDLLSALDCLGQRLLAGVEEHRDLRLLVVDSIRGPLAPILAQPGGPNGLYLMGVVGKTLNYLALRFGLCIVVVNGVVADRGPAHERASTGGAGGGSGGGGGMHAMWGFKPALGPYWSTFPSLRLLLRLLPPSSSSSSSTWRLGGHEAGGGGDEQPLLCEAALYSAAHQDALPPAPPANAHVVGSKRAFFMVTAAGVADPPTRATPPPPPTTTTTSSTSSSGGGGGGGPGVIPPYQPQSARGGT